MDKLLEKLLEQESPLDKGIFKPASEDEIQRRVLEYIKSVCTQNSDGTWSCAGDIDLSGMQLVVLPVKFREVKGYFDCYHNQLRTLEGTPRIVGGDFSCCNNQLRTLEGAPEKVGGDFNCSWNQLRTLEGAPKYIGNKFWCHANPVPESELKKTVDRNYLKR